MLVEERVERGPRDGVVVVREVFAALQEDVVLLAVEGIERLQLGKTLDGHFLRPVVGRVHALRLRWRQSAANSTLPVFTRSRVAFSQVQPPCMDVLTITTGKESLMRSSIAARIIVCVPPPLAPVTATRSGSTSGRLRRKSRLRIELSVCKPMTHCNAPPPAG